MQFIFFTKKNTHILLIINIVIINNLVPCFSQPNIKHDKQLYLESVRLYKDGQCENSIAMLKSILKNDIDTVNLIAINNMLGIVYMDLGYYNKAIYYYKRNLNFLNRNPIKESKIYNNIGVALKNQGKQVEAIKFIKKAIKQIIYSKESIKSKKIFSINKYYNIGLAYLNLKNYKKTIEYLNKSLSIRKQYNLQGIDKVYFNLARTYFELNDYKKTNFYYAEAIKKRKNEFGNNYYRLAPLYMNYGDFQRTQRQYKKAKKNLQKAIKLYENNYKKKHPFTANSYVYFGKYYLSVQKYDSALYWFQKSLIANSKHFNDNNILKNPEINDCFSGPQMLRSVKMKARAIQKFANTQNINKKKELLELSIKTSDIALSLVSSLRKDYIYSDSKLIITEEEKECYSISVDASIDLFKITNNIKYAKLAYKYASESKASVMNENLEQIKEMYELIPDSLMSIKEEQEQKISAYKKLIFEENEKLKPNSSKINLWENKLFDLNNSYDDFIEKLKNNYKISKNITKKYIPVKEIQNNLPYETTLVEYFISKDKDAEELNLYTFIISKNNFKYLKNKLSKDFYKNISFFKKHFYNDDNLEINVGLYNKANKILYNLYNELFKPIKNILKTKDIILVPDEEIAFISFDALLSEYELYKNINYSNLNYLIYDYCFSYAYSTNLLFRKDNTEYSNFVYAFAPDYIEKETRTKRQKLGKLNNTQKEISAILTYFNGKAYTGSFASVDSFKTVLKKGAALHLAMHSFSNEDQKDFSCLAFSNIENENNLLYAYEIEKMKINSPMLVLSSCNSGTGKLYSGEGIMSLSRSFIKAGVPAVIHSLWDVNDDVGYKIMDYFYKNLAQGKTKNIALRNAKLKYLQEASPTFANPEYWASYVLTGDVSPIKRTSNLQYLIYILTLIIIILGFIFVRKKITN